jgi:hypothetical protein
MPVDGERWLFDQVGLDASIRSQFLKPESQSGVDRQAVERYMDQVVEFREKLAVLMLSSVTAWNESCRLVYLSRTAAYMRLAG